MPASFTAFRAKRQFVRNAVFGTLGSKLPFAALKVNAR
jgi:hypothetical protein